MPEGLSKHAVTEPAWPVGYAMFARLLRTCVPAENVEGRPAAIWVTQPPRGPPAWQAEPVARPQYELPSDFDAGGGLTLTGDGETAGLTPSSQERVAWHSATPVGP